MTYIDDIDKDILLIEQKVQLLNDESFNIHNASDIDNLNLTLMNRNGIK